MTCEHYKTWGTDRVVLCQDAASFDSQPGDSGGPVFVIESGTNVLMAGIYRGRFDPNIFGMYWRRAFSPMSQVRQQYPGLELLQH